MGGLTLAALGGRIWSGLGGAWSWMTERPERLLSALLFAAIAVAIWQWNRADALEERIDRVGKAQSAAGKLQATVNQFPVLQSKAIAEKSDADSQSYYEAGRRAGLAYADAHRVRAATCPAGAADLSGADRPVPLDDGPGETADMVAVTRADFDLLTGNSLRLAKVHQDADALIAAGVAVPLSSAPDAGPDR